MAHRRSAASISIAAVAAGGVDWLAGELQSSSPPPADLCGHASSVSKEGGDQ
jgi:hypothetical protein